MLAILAGTAILLLSLYLWRRGPALYRDQEYMFRALRAPWPTRETKFGQYIYWSQTILLPLVVAAFGLLFIFGGLFSLL